MSERLYSTPDFSRELEAITHAPVMTAAIDSYAEDALTALISLSQNAIDLYQQQPVQLFESAKQLEDAAFSYFNLDNITETLDHIVSKANELNNIDALIASAERSDEVFVPAESIALPKGRTVNEYEQARLVPKLKTLLFIIGNEYSIDLNDPAQLQITEGSVSSKQVRNNAYYLVEVPKIKRTILICDEVGNVTYVYDAEKLAENGIGSAELQNAGKTELNGWASSRTPYGKRVMYRSNFVGQLIDALEEPLPTGQNRSSNDPNAGNYLVPMAPEGVISLTALSRVLGVKTWRMLDKVVAGLSDQLGEVRDYRFGSRLVPGYTEVQKEIIREQVTKLGYYEAPPVGHSHVGGMGSDWGIAASAIKRAIKQLGEELGDPRSFNSAARVTKYYSPEQVAKIRAQMTANGAFSPKAPEFFDSVAGIAQTFNIDHSTARKAVEAVHDSIGEVGTYLFGPRAVKGYSPMQQNAIYDQLKQSGVFAKIAPEGVVSTTMFHSILNLPSPKPVSRAIEALGDKLGPVDIYRFGKSKAAALGYTKPQQDLIEQYLIEDGTLSPPPNGYAGRTELAEEFGITVPVLHYAIKMIGDTLGSIKNYRKPGALSSASPYYSPAQKQIIRDHLVQRGHITQ
jgi:hypothetical protein